MIDRILCVCQTKGESLKWVDHLRQQIKSSRQPSQGPNISSTSMLGGHMGPTGVVGSLGNPPPPPHVSYNHQPFELLTVWIRNQIVGGKLTREELINMTKREYFSKSFQETNDGLPSKDIKCRMRKEKKQLIRPTNKVEGQFFSAAPEVNVPLATTSQEKSKRASLSYNFTIEPMKEENDYEVITSLSNANEKCPVNYDTSSKDKDCGEVTPKCDTKSKISCDQLDEFLENDEDTITILIPDRSFGDSEERENLGKNSIESIDQLSFYGKNPFENESEDDEITLVSSNYDDETSSLFHGNSKLLGPWGKMFPKQEIANNLHSPTNSTNYCSCNLEDLYKIQTLDIATRLNSLPLNLGHCNENIKNQDCIENEYLQIIQNTNVNSNISAVPEEANVNVEEDNSSLVYVDNSTSETSSMCVPYLPPMQVRYSDFDKMTKYAKIRPQNHIYHDCDKSEKGTAKYGLQQQASISSSECHEYVPHRIRELRSVTPDRELLKANFHQEVPDYAYINRNSKTSNINEEELIEEEDNIYAKLETIENRHEPFDNGNNCEKAQVNKEINCAFNADSIYACQCQCFPLIGKKSNQITNVIKTNSVPFPKSSNEDVACAVEGNSGNRQPPLNDSYRNYQFDCLPLSSMNHNSPSLQRNNDPLLQDNESLQSILEDRQAMQSIEEELNESIDDVTNVPMTPDILRHVPNHQPFTASETNLTVSSHQDEIESNQDIQPHQITTDEYGHLPYHPNSIPPYYYDSLWERYQSLEGNNNATVDMIPQVNERNEHLCSPYSGENLTDGPLYSHKKSRGEKRRKCKTCRPMSSSTLSCIPRRSCKPKSVNYCGTNPDENAEDIYGFTPNWPEDWNNNRACQVPLGSLSQDTGEEQQFQNDEAFTSYTNQTDAFEVNPTPLPIYSINRVMRNMPSHNSVLVTPEVTSELYLECTLSARWLLIERYPDNGFHMSSGGSSIGDSQWRQPYTEHPEIQYQNPITSGYTKKKESRTILSTLV